jgi:acetamidase/formamidase
MKLDFKSIIIIVLLILLLLTGGALYIKGIKNDMLKEKVSERDKFLAVLNDSLTVVKNKNGELEYSKKSLQNDIKFLEKNYQSLSDNQKLLLNEVKNNKQIIAAMRAEMVVLIQDIKNGNATIINDTTISFSDSTKNLIYTIEVSGVKPSNKPELTIKEIELPNTTTVKFEWEKEKDYPVKGTIVNSNPYIKTNEMDSFIIPEVKKEDIKPTFWQKTKKSAKNVVKTGKWVIIGVGVGLLISAL